MFEKAYMKDNKTASTDLAPDTPNNRTRNIERVYETKLPRCRTRKLATDNKGLQSAQTDRQTDRQLSPQKTNRVNYLKAYILFSHIFTQEKHRKEYVGEKA